MHLAETFKNDPTMVFRWSAVYFQRFDLMLLVPGQNVIIEWSFSYNDWFAGNEKDESDTYNFDNDSDGGNSNNEVYTWLS